LTTYLGARRDELSFGDICEAEFLYDVYVRGDARALGRDQTSASFAKKKYGVDEAIQFFIPDLELKEGENYVLSHGWHRRAVCISDDCLILSALGRGDREPDGRLLFAPIVPATEGDLKELDEAPTYGRFPLPGDAVFSEHAIVELRRCFMADARDIHAVLPGLVVLSTTDETRLGLANRWAAYACRRGPFVVEDNLEKFAQLLVERGVGEDDAVGLAEALGKVAGTAWAYEGGALEGAGIAGDEGADPAPVLKEIERHLEALGTFLPEALSTLQSVATRA
jgi:hypothetical protein